MNEVTLVTINAPNTSLRALKHTLTTANQRAVGALSKIHS